MTKAELLCRHFVNCFRLYRSQSPDVQRAIERLAGAASDPDATSSLRDQAIVQLAFLLFHADTELATFGRRVGEVMRAKGMTQSDLAVALGVTQQAISRILCGRHRPRRQTVKKVAEALAIPVGEISS
jgi:DNA-binding XRE family transcriptional regulator